MTSQLIAFILAILQIAAVSSKKGFGPGEQDWGYARVSDGAFMFYWLYYTTAPVQNYTQRPLIVWLQGGPGVPASYFGNFNFIGPLDENLNDRNCTWTQYVNVLYFDSPVGIGFSYVNSFDKYPRTNNEIALQLVEAMKIFYKKYPEFIRVPLHIYGESYAGKMAAEFALEFYRAHKRGQIEGDLKSVNMANPWISPRDYLDETPKAAFYMGMIQKNEMDQMYEKVNKLYKLMDKGLWTWAYVYAWVVIHNTDCDIMQGVSIFNIHYQIREKDKEYCGLSFLNADNAKKLMQGPVKEALNITEQWKALFLGIINLSADVYKPAFHIVNQVLNSTNVKVNVFTGSYDVLVPTVGTLRWINRLAWNSRSSYDKATRKAFYIDGILEGFEKIGKDFSLYWIHRSGHMIAKDNLKALTYAMKKIANIK